MFKLFITLVLEVVKRVVIDVLIQIIRSETERVENEIYDLFNAA